MQTGLPEQLRTASKSAEPPWDGVSTPLEVLLEIACPIEHSWDVDGTKGPQMLLTPEEVVASCDMQRESKPICRLIYAMVAVLFVLTRTSLPQRPPVPAPKAQNTSGQGIQPATRGI